MGWGKCQNFGATAVKAWVVTCLISESSISEAGPRDYCKWQVSFRACWVPIWQLSGMRGDFRVIFFSLFRELWNLAESTMWSVGGHFHSLPSRPEVSMLVASLELNGGGKRGGGNTLNFPSAQIIPFQLIRLLRRLINFHLRLICPHDSLPPQRNNEHAVPIQPFSQSNIFLHILGVYWEFRSPQLHCWSKWQI